VLILISSGDKGGLLTTPCGTRRSGWIRQTHRPHAPVETATPLANALVLPINQSFANHDYRSLAKAILSNETYAGKTNPDRLAPHANPYALRCARCQKNSGEMAGDGVQSRLEMYGPDGRASVQQITEPF
jgi:hypothetical protein